MSNKGRLYGEKKKKATTVINFNVHGKQAKQKHVERITEEQKRQIWPIFTVRRGRNKKRY